MTTSAHDDLDHSLRREWTLPDDVTYLNHGSFGPSPRCVQSAREDWSRRLESQPMDFFVRQLESLLDEAAARLGEWIGAAPADLAFVENATAGMNIVAANVPLQPRDEVLCTSHEYGAVLRIWRRACERAGANLIVRPFTLPVDSADELVDAFFAAATGRTRLIVVSHVTSATAMVLPVEAICRRAKERGIPVCIDGPHAVAMVPLNLRRLDCDFYAASCHKWLSAPFGSGFLYVAPRRQQTLAPAVMSWGRSLSGRPWRWQDEFSWSGTRDPAAYLSIPAAIDFLERIGIDAFRQRSHALAQYARRRIVELTGLEPDIPDSDEWYGTMVALPIPKPREEPPKSVLGDPLQERLWTNHRIEVPVIAWHAQRTLRVSCHLYNTRDDIDRLVAALERELAVER